MQGDVFESYRRELAGLSLRGAVLMGLRSALRVVELPEQNGIAQPAERMSRLRVAAKWAALGWDAPETAADLDGAADIEAYLARTQSDASRSESVHAAYLAALFERCAEHPDREQDEAAQNAVQAEARDAAHAAQLSALAAALVAAGDPPRAVRHSFAALTYASRATMAVWPASTTKRPDLAVAFDAATRADFAAIRAQEAASPDRRPSLLTLGPLWTPDAPPSPSYTAEEGPYGCALEIELPIGLPLDDVVAWSCRLLSHANGLSLAQGGGGFRPRTVELTPRRIVDRKMTIGRCLRIVLEHVHDDPSEQTRALLAEILHAQTLVRAERGVSDSRAWIRGHVCIENDADVAARILARLQAEPAFSAGWRRQTPGDPTPEQLAQLALRDVMADAPHRAPPGSYGPFLGGRVAPLGLLLLLGDFLSGRKEFV